MKGYIMVVNIGNILYHQGVHELPDDMKHKSLFFSHIKNVLTISTDNKGVDNSESVYKDWVIDQNIFKLDNYQNVVNLLKTSIELGDTNCILGIVHILSIFNIRIGDILRTNDVDKYISTVANSDYKKMIFILCTILHIYNTEYLHNKCVLLPSYLFTYKNKFQTDHRANIEKLINETSKFYSMVFLIV